MTKWISKIREWVLQNPVAWLLLGLFLIAEYNNYKKGVEIQHICELTGRHDIALHHPQSDKEELDNICIGHLSDD